VMSTPVTLAEHRQRAASPETRGIVPPVSAWVYDLLVRWFVTRGREQEFRDWNIWLAGLQPGESVLDVGCGTGTLALVAKERVGETGRVLGVDPSAKLIAGARRKATRRRLDIDFQLGGIERLALPDQSFDVVLNSFVMHHLPDGLKRQGLAEIARVLKPGGRVLLVDYKRSEAQRGRPASLGAGHLGIQDVPALMEEVGLSHIETGDGPVAIRSLAGLGPGYGYALGRMASEQQRSANNRPTREPLLAAIPRNSSVAGRSAGEGPSPSESLIDLRRVVKAYESPSGPFTALRDVSLEVQTGEFVAVVGKSGSGKTTLLNVLAGIDRPTGGQISVAGTDVRMLSESQLAEWRGRAVGLVFQFFQLLPTLTVAENVMLPMDFGDRIRAAERRSRALALLGRVGIRDQADKLPATLSGGEQQRAAIARALANDPPILLADEPTGNLDSGTGESVLKLFADLNAEGRTIVMVTHERDVRRYVSRQVTLVDGRVAHDVRAEIGQMMASEVLP
jgi:putative ABC transport system ATP-binding protein